MLYRRLKTTYRLLTTACAVEPAQRPTPIKTEVEFSTSLSSGDVEQEEEVVLPKSAVYKAYLNMCKEQGLKPQLKQPGLGKMVRNAFPGVMTKRRGPRGRVVQFYVGLQQVALESETEQCLPGCDEVSAVVSKAWLDLLMMPFWFAVRPLQKSTTRKKAGAGRASGRRSAEMLILSAIGRRNSREPPATSWCRRSCGRTSPRQLSSAKCSRRLSASPVVPPSPLHPANRPSHRPSGRRGGVRRERALCDSSNSILHERKPPLRSRLSTHKRKSYLIRTSQTTSSTRLC